MGFSGGSVVKNPPVNAADTGSISGCRRSPGGYGNSLQHSCLGNPIDRGAGWATVHRVQLAWGWCMGMTQRDVVGREVGGGVHVWERM